MVYTVEDKIQFIKWFYGGHSFVEIRDLFSGLNPHKDVPSKSTIERIVNQFNTTGCVAGNNCSKNNNIIHVVKENKFNVIASIVEDPNQSVRNIGKNLGIHFSSVHKILKKE